MNKELGAQAFANGSDIYYGTGKSPGKDELTAHELTHIIQQGGAVPTKSVTQQQKKENKLQASPDAMDLTTEPPKASRDPDPMEWELTEQPQEASSEEQIGKRKRENSKSPDRPTSKESSQKKRRVGSSLRAPETGESSSSSTNQSPDPRPTKKGKGKSKEEKTKTPMEQAIIKMGYELEQGKKGKVGKIIKTASYENVGTQPHAKEICYVASVPTRINDKAPKDIARQYVNEGFTNPKDAKRRFGLVVGVNEFESVANIKDTIKGIETKVDTAGWTDCRLGVLGFTWHGQWKRANDNNDPNLKEKPDLTAVRDAYNKLEPAEQNLICQSENNAKKGIIPYDGIREEIKKHNFTIKFRDALTNDNTVYLVTGDPDAVSLKAPPSLGEEVAQDLDAASPSLVEEVTQDLDAVNLEAAPSKQQGDQGESSKKDKGKLKEVPVQKMAHALFERYDQIIKNYMAANNNQTPTIVSGGYEFRMKGLGGQTEDALRGAANKLDMAVRQAMAKINPSTVYFPEPNTIFKMEPKGRKALNGTFTSKEGKSEGQALVAMMRKNKSLENKEMIFDLNAAIETNSDRFKTIIDKKEVNLTINWTGGEIKELTTEHIKSLFENSQTHVKKNYWIRRVMSQYPGGQGSEDLSKRNLIGKGRGTAITDVYEHYFPHELIKPYNPKILKQKLNTYTNEPTYGSVSDATKKNLDLTGDYDSVISLAKESGKAVEIFLKEILGIK
jgi:hypothetical protein